MNQNPFDELVKLLEDAQRRDELLKQEWIEAMRNHCDEPITVTAEVEGLPFSEYPFLPMNPN